MGPVLGPHARTDRTRDTRVAEHWLPAPEDGRPGEGRRLTPDAPHSGGRPPPRGRPPTTPAARSPHRACRPRGQYWAPTPTHRAHSTWVADPNSPPSGRAVGGGTAPDLRRPSQWQKAPPPGTPFGHPDSEQCRPARAHAVGIVLGPHTHTDRARDTRVAEPRLPAQEDRGPGEGQCLTPDAPRNSGRPPPPGTPLRDPHNEQRTNAPTHQPRDIRTPPPALRHSDTTMAEPAVPRKTRTRSPMLDASHEVIRALGLRDGERDPPQGDAGTDSDLEAIPEPSTGSAPAEPAPPAGSVPALCPAWKRGHCTGEGRCLKQHPQPGPDDGALPEVGPAAACPALRYGVAQGWILDETARGSVNIQEAVDRVTQEGQAAVALHTRGRHGGPAEGIIVEPSGMVLVLAADMV